jgi:hypothetical protein
MREANAGQWVIALTMVAACIVAIVIDCTDSAAEVRMREAHKLCRHAIEARCLSLALQPGALYRAKHEELVSSTR